MKSAPIVILALAVGLVGGYVIRDSTVDEVAPRGGDRRAESTKLPVLPDTTLAEAPDVVPDQTGSARIDPGEEEAHAACGEGESAYS